MQSCKGGWFHPYIFLFPGESILGAVEVSFVADILETTGFNEFIAMICLVWFNLF